MGEIVNLRAARKARVRDAAAAAAAANRVRFGRSKAAKRLTEIEAARAARLLDAAKRDA